MRLSLVTRVSGSYLLLLVFLLGVMGFAVTSLDGMKREVSLLRQGLFPTTARLQQFNQEMTRAYVTLKGGTPRDLLWLSHHLPELDLFNALAVFEASFSSMAKNTELDESVRLAYRELQLQVNHLITSHSMAQVLDLKGHRIPEDWRNLKNSELFGHVLSKFCEQAENLLERRTTPDSSGWRDMLEQLLGTLRKEGIRLEAQFNLASSAGLSSAREGVGRAVTVSVVLIVASLVLILTVFVLLQRWLRPLGALGQYAQKLALGQYDHPLPLGSQDEIGDLATELARMSQRLKEREEMIRNQARELVRGDRFATIGKMSTQIAHEIRNPLNAMGLKLELLEDLIDEVRPELSDHRIGEMSSSIQSITREIDRLREITEYYLKFAKFPKVEKEITDLPVVLGDLVGFYAEEAQRKGISIETEMEPSVRCPADANLLRHAVSNLLKNALEAIHMDGRADGMVWVKVWRSGDRAHISVKDNGPGIPPEQLDRVFEPFFSSKKGGTGLGLTLVQQIIQEHGGEIRCSSESGSGAVFSISLPM